MEREKKEGHIRNTKSQTDSSALAVQFWEMDHKIEIAKSLKLNNLVTRHLGGSCSKKNTNW